MGIKWSWRNLILLGDKSQKRGESVTFFKLMILALCKNALNSLANTLIAFDLLK